MFISKSTRPAIAPLKKFITHNLRNNTYPAIRTAPFSVRLPFQGLRFLSTEIPFKNPQPTKPTKPTISAINQPLKYPIPRLPAPINGKIIIEANGYKVVPFNFQKYPINFPNLDDLQKTPFIIPGPDQEDSAYASMMLARLKSDVQFDTEENRNPTTHSRNMWLAYDNRQESNGALHRYLLKCIKIKEYPAAQQLAAREWAIPYIGVAVGLEHFFTKTFVKTKNNEQGEKEFWIGRRFLNASSGNKLVASPADAPASVLPTQTLIDAFAFNAMTCSTELANSGNVLYMLDEDGNPRSKVMINTPITIIDNERSTPNKEMMEHLKRLTQVQVNAANLSGCEADAAYILSWEPGKPYLGSPAWRRGESARMGRQQHIENTMHSFDPYAAVLDYRIKQGEIPDADQLYVSEELIDNIISQAEIVRGIMHEFALYPKEELVSPNNPFNEFVDLCQQRRNEGRRISLADCITGFTEAQQTA